MGYRWKLFSSFMALVLLLGVIFYFAASSILQREMLSQSRESLLNQARLLRVLLERDGVVPSPQALARLLGTETGERVTLIAHDGKVIGESGVLDEQLDRVENHLLRSEVQQALTSKEGHGSSVRFSSTVGTDMLYTALRTKMGGNYGVVRLALPLTHLDQTRQSLRHLLGGVSALLLLLALFLTALLAERATRPLREIGECAARIGRGEHGVRALQSEQGEIGYLALRINEMAERVESQMRHLSAEKQRLHTILGSMGEGVMVTAADGSITLVNPAFCDMFAIKGDIIGKNLLEISRHPDLLDAFKDLGRSDINELQREIHIPAVDRTLLTHWTPLTLDGAREGGVAVFHDITELKRMENLRRDFVANVSHELRTPVTIIKGYAETLLDGALTTDQTRAFRFIEIISNHADRLASLISDILALASLEKKGAAPELAPLLLSGVIARGCALLHERAEQKNIRILNAVENDDISVMAERQQLEQVVVNLLENAIKYTPEGGVVSLSAREEGGVVRVSVEDNGIGIPLKYQPRIFERFYRVDESRTREQGGTGLGLAIVKHIVQLHGGEVTVDSEPGKGSVFSFTLKRGIIC